MKKIRIFFAGCILMLASTLALANPVNVNTADAEELVTLSGIGATRAQAIIEYRENNPPFESLEDLTQVPGIGQRIVSDNADRIIFSDD